MRHELTRVAVSEFAPNKFICSLLAALCSVVAGVSASAQTGIVFDRAEVTLEPGEAYLDPRVGSISDHHLVPGFYVLRYGQPGNALLRDLRISVDGDVVLSGKSFHLASRKTLGVSFFVGENSLPGDSSVVVELFDLDGNFIDDARFNVRVRFESRSCLTCLRAWDGVNHAVSEVDERSVNADRPWCLAFEVHQLTDLGGGALRSGDLVGVQSWLGRYWSAQPNGELEANREALLPWEMFEIRKVGAVAGAAIHPGDPIALKSFHQQWVVAPGGGGGSIFADSPAQGDFETFTYLPGPTQQVCLQAHGAQYVASKDDQLSVAATQKQCTGDAVHELIDIDGGDLLSWDAVYVRSRHGRFWSAQPGGSLDANRLNAGTWERFQVVKVSGSPDPLIGARDGVALRSWHGKWVVAEGGGGGEVAADRDRALQWETFELVPVTAFPFHGDCGIERSAGDAFLSGCVGECGQVFEAQVAITSSGAATGCAASCGLELTVLETMCPTDVGRIELFKNGIHFATYDVRDPSFESFPQRVIIEASLQAGDLLTVRVSDEPLVDPDLACKRLGNFRFQLALLR